MLKQLYPKADEDWLQQELEHYQGGYLGLAKRLTLARQHQGDTVFDWLIDIIQQYPEIELRLE